MTVNKQGASQKKQKLAVNNNFLILSVVAIVGIGIFSIESMLMVAIGLIPTYIAFIIGPSEGRRYVGICVGCTNFCGIFPFLVDLWEGGSSMIEALGIMRDPFCWLVMYGAAGVGWGAVYALPPMLTSMLKSAGQRKIRDIEKNQEKLIREWGEYVSNPKIT